MRRLAIAVVILTSCSTGPIGTTTSTAGPATTTGPATSAVAASRFGVIGWWDGDEWITPRTVFDVPVGGGEQYRVVSLDQPITTAVGGAATLCEPSATPIIAFSPPLPGDHRQPGAIAVLADWELRPQQLSVGGEVPAQHQAAVIDVVGLLGIDDPAPTITQFITVDLEGDGGTEIVLVAKRVPDDLLGGVGDYSVALLRKQIDGEWRTATLESSLGVADNIYVVSHTIPAVVDLNGDGKMEIVVDGHYYEGAGTAAYEYVDDDLGPQVVLSGGCGA
ncbi:MAG TPA: VCBS repeat-containing protein [Acidimicrobiia bacterium]|nr:VCBS repeat-containing protein [Acidimicrobiia bacterium]